MSDHFDKPGDENKLKSMSGDRRLVRIVMLNHNSVPAEQHRWLICPEPFAGAILARGTSSGLTIVKQAEGTDATTQAATLVDTRADVVRLYQDATHRWCMLRAEGDIDGPAYVARLKELDAMAFTALTNKPPAAAATADKPKDEQAKSEKPKTK